MIDNLCYCTVFVMVLGIVSFVSYSFPMHKIDEASTFLHRTNELFAKY